MADSEEYKAKYERELERRLQLEQEVKEKESLLAQEHDKVIIVEQGLLNDADALNSLEQQHIAVLRHQLKAENERKVAAEKERDELKAELEREKGRRSKYESNVGELEKEMMQLEETLRQKEKLVDTIKTTERVGAAETGWVKNEVDDLKEFADRLGSMKVSEACRMLRVDAKKMEEYIRELAAGGYIELQHAETRDPTIKATKKLIEEMSEMRMELRKRGRTK